MKLIKVNRSQPPKKTSCQCLKQSTKVNKSPVFTLIKIMALIIHNQTSPKNVPERPPIFTPLVGCFQMLPKVTRHR